MQFDINKQLEICKDIEKIEERPNAGVVRLFILNIQIYLIIQRQKFDSATYEKKRQEGEKN